MPTTHDLSRTEAAIAAYDALDAIALQGAPSLTTNAEVEELFAKLEAAGAEVGRAFGLDTAGFNNPETCEKYIRPGPKNPPPGSELSFVRQTVRRWRALNQRAALLERMRTLALRVRAGNALQTVEAVDLATEVENYLALLTSGLIPNESFRMRPGGL